MRSLWLPMLPLIFAAGCTAAATPPLDSVAAAARAIESAERHQAAELAPVQLDLARRKLKEARERLAREEQARYDEARRLAEQAQTDARAAETQSELLRTDAAHRDLRGRVDTLENEVSRVP